MKKTKKKILFFNIFDYAILLQHLFFAFALIAISNENVKNLIMILTMLELNLLGVMIAFQKITNLTIFEKALDKTDKK